MTTSPLDAPNTDSRALTTPQVGAQVLQNVLGGVGAGVVVATCLWLANVPLEAAWRWPVGIAVITAGLATAWRAWIDEWRAERNWRKREQEHHEEMLLLILDLEDTEAERDNLRGERNALLSTVARLERENASLNYEWRAAKASPRTVLVEDLVEPEAKRNARHIVSVWAQTGKRPSRSEMVPATMTRTQWDAAYAEIMGAGLLTGAHTEAEMLHMLDVRWAAPFPVSDGQPDAPTSRAGREDSPSRPEMEQ